MGWCSVLSIVSDTRKAQTEATTKIQRDGSVSSPGMGWKGLIWVVCIRVCVYRIFGQISAMQYEDAVVATTLRSRRSGVRC